MFKEEKPELLTIQLLPDQQNSTNRLSTETFKPLLKKFSLNQSLKELLLITLKKSISFLLKLKSLIEIQSLERLKSEILVELKMSLDLVDKSSTRLTYNQLFKEKMSMSNLIEEKTKLSK